MLGENVIDQVCERDFYFGIAQSGISILKNGKVLKSPYFKPYLILEDGLKNFQMIF